jgi:transcriptional repressor NrdR
MIGPISCRYTVSGEKLDRTTTFGALSTTYAPINPILGCRGAAQVPSKAFEIVVCWHGEGAVMHCPFCRHPDSRVVDSRETDEGQAIRRRRSCPECGRRFTTVETAVLAVVKRSGVTEPFSREKVVRGVRRACQGRQVDDDALNLLAQQVEDTVRATGSPEVPSHEVGLAILGPLRELDEVAYLRFASVYRGFTSAEDFEREIEALRAHRKSPQPAPN